MVKKRDKYVAQHPDDHGKEQVVEYATAPDPNRCTCPDASDAGWKATDAEPHHPGCPRYTVTAEAVKAPPKPEPPKELPLPLASFITHAGLVEEITWTTEDDVIKARKWNKDEHSTLVARRWLRSAAKQGMITARRNPEHGYWEYGPQWRAKDFTALLNAAEAAVLLGAKVE